MKGFPGGKPRSLRSMLMTVIVFCWVVPIAIVAALAGTLLNISYQRSARQELESGAQNALRQVELRLESLFDASKSVSYDGVVRNAYRSSLYDGDQAVLYRTVNDYLAQSFSRSELVEAAYISFWEDIGVYPYAAGSGALDYGALRSYRADVEEALLDEMRDADTAIRLLEYGGELYIARNLLDSRFDPYATVVLLCNRELLFRSLDEVRRISAASLTIDGTVTLQPDGTLVRTEADDEPESDMVFFGAADGHELRLDAAISGLNVWAAMPELRTAVTTAALLVLPLLLVMIFLFRRRVTRPVETLVTAATRVQEGERGYVIGQRANSREFQKLFGHFNAMSTELQKQFERSYLEQQALQQAKMKALQSQINPHFLNNTLEIINWEARIAGNDRVGAMIEALSTMLDAALDRKGLGSIRLREELGYADAYLYIIRQRMGERLTVVKQVDEALSDAMVPRLILQPILENAVEHDLTARRGGTLSIRAFREDGRIVLEVEHDGTLSDADRKNIDELLTVSAAETEPADRVGLRNVAQRLKLLYGGEGEISIVQSEPDTILARMSFPVEREELPQIVQ